MSMRHKHIGTGTMKDGQQVMLCGESGWRDEASSPEGTTCPSCSAKHFAKLIPANVKLERWDEKAETGMSYTSYRSVYRLLIDDVHRAYVICRSGWGAGWVVMGCYNNPYKNGLQTPSGSAHEFDNRGYRGLVFNSKEAAIAKAANFIISNTERAQRDFKPALSADEYKKQEEESERRQALADRKRKQEHLAETIDELRGLNEEITEAELRLLALRGINVEAPASVDALRWAIDLAEEAVKGLNSRVENRTKIRNKLEGELQ